MLIEIEEVYAWDFKYELKYNEQKITGESVLWKEGDNDFEDVVLNENEIPSGWMIDENGEFTDDNEAAVDFLPNEVKITIFDIQPRVCRNWEPVKNY